MEAVAWTAIGLLGVAVLGSFSSFFYLGTRIDALGARLDSRIDAQGLELGSRIDAQGLELGSRIDALSARIDAQDPSTQACFVRPSAPKVTWNWVYVSNASASKRPQFAKRVRTTIQRRSPPSNVNGMNLSRSGSPTPRLPASRFAAVSSLTGISSSFCPVSWIRWIFRGSGQ